MLGRHAWVRFKRVIHLLYVKTFASIKRHIIVLRYRSRRIRVVQEERYVGVGVRVGKLKLSFRVSPLPGNATLGSVSYP